jgi:NAD-dependent dihydropyrimidine dehydrogenase PreA subunit
MAENTIIFCNCGARQESSVWMGAEEKLRQFENINLTILSDLCGFCALDPEKLKELISNSEKVLIIGCHPRSLRLLLGQAGIGSSEKIRFFDLLENSDETLSEILSGYITPGPVSVPNPQMVHDPSWPAWYPVIDPDRCNKCGQCADFCLFGVYRKTAEKVEVVNPKGCKNNCPACARICPQVAIVFPKYVPGGPISGSDSFNESAEMQRLQQDTDAILGSDIYLALEQRKMKRRKIFRADAMQQAIRERDAALGNPSPEK